MGTSLILQEHQPMSNRWAMLDNDGYSVWLVLTYPAIPSPEQECWLFHTRSDAFAGFDDPGNRMPPPPPDLVHPGSTVERFCAEDFRILWSQNGHGLGVLFQNRPLGFILPEHGRGYSRNLKGVCPWGLPFDDALFREVFLEVDGQ